jgi:hypothetical protein
MLPPPIAGQAPFHAPQASTTGGITPELMEQRNQDGVPLVDTLSLSSGTTGASTEMTDLETRGRALADAKKPPRGAQGLKPSDVGTAPPPAPNPNAHYDGR